MEIVQDLQTVKDEEAGERDVEWEEDTEEESSPAEDT